MLGRFIPVFNEAQEKDLAHHIRKMDEYFYGLTFKDLRLLAFQFAESNNIQHRFNANTKLAGRDWALIFLKKHKLSLRTPSKTSLARIMVFNKVQVDLFYTNLEQLIIKFNFPSSRIYNMDESGMSTVSNKSSKVISTQGKKGVGKISSAERGKLSTVICTVSASGNYVPPVIIFARKRVKHDLMNGAPPGSMMLCSDSGYSNSDLFLIWLQHFQKYVVSSTSTPTLLILDNHSSHINIDAVLYCRQNDIHLLSLPPHSSHKMQPLDRCFFKPLKEYFSQMCDKWLLNHPGRVITQYQVAELFGEACEKAATMRIAVNGFKCCGIYPINKYIFSEEDFLPSSVTEQNVPTENRQNDIDSSAVLDESNNDSETCQDLALNDESREDIRAMPATSHSLSAQINYVLPSDLIPFPKRQTAQQRKSKKQRSEILTSSPYK